jgi:hypothetical protein
VLACMGLGSSLLDVRSSIVILCSSVFALQSAGFAFAGFEALRSKDYLCFFPLDS